MSHPPTSSIQPGAAIPLEIQRFEGDVAFIAADLVAVESPLEMRLVFGPRDRRVARSISVTMRTPGDDLDLTAGFLFTEGILRSWAGVEEMTHCGPTIEGQGSSNVVRVELHPEVEVDLARLERHFYTTSSCGVCGKTSLEAIEAQGVPTLHAGPRVSAQLIAALPARLRAAQSVFEQTGGLHGAALVDGDGQIVCLREDVGRHNAVDKVLGARLREAASADAPILMVSGRGGFELVQKALMGAVPIFVAVGAPSSLAVELARRHGMTLVGFLREGRFNIYSGPERLNQQ